MAVGTAGFIGANLTSAREARQVTQASLSRMLDVSRAAISDFELGKKTPSPATMQRIQEVLNLPYEYFLRQPFKPQVGPVFYRSMSAATKTARVAAEARFNWMKFIVQYLKEYMNFPPVKFPVLDVPDNIQKLDFDYIEELANETRKFWGLGVGSLSNVTWLLENQGAIIGRFPLEAATLDAFSEWSPHDDTPYIVLGDDKGIAVRSRFDAAHELGHLILHRGVDRKSISNTTDYKLIERQAHRFAAAFLFPAEAYLSEVFMPSLELFRNLKVHWKVSIQLQIQRGVDLGIIGEEQALRMWKNCMRRGWKMKEPLDDSMEVEEPRVLARSIKMLLAENVRSKFDLLAALPFSVGDILELVHLPRGYFEDRPDTIISFKDFRSSKERDTSQSDTEAGDRFESDSDTAKVIHFNRRMS